MYTKQLDFWPVELNRIRLERVIGSKYRKYVHEMNMKANYFERKGLYFYAEKCRASIKSIENFADTKEMKRYRFTYYM